MPLVHIQIPSRAPSLPTYAFAASLQSKLQRRLLDYKAAASTSQPPPPPILLTFTPAPTYTLGRRQTSPLSQNELDRLRSPLVVENPLFPVLPQRGPNQRWPDRLSAAQKQNRTGNKYQYRPEIVHAPRGGLTTFHGPGQVVFWPVIDLHSPLHKHLTVRDYACVLEKTTIAALAHIPEYNEVGIKSNRPALQGFTTDNPGVWVKNLGAASDERKIAALGVHLRRHVTGLGVAVNTSMPVTGPETHNPWARITACGLEDKQVTSVRRELELDDSPVRMVNHGFLTNVWAQEFVKRLGIADGVVLRFSWRRKRPHRLIQELEESLGLADMFNDKSNFYPVEGGDVSSEDVE